MLAKNHLGESGSSSRARDEGHPCPALGAVWGTAQPQRLQCWHIPCGFGQCLTFREPAMTLSVPFRDIFAAQRFARMLSSPWLDRAIAVIAVVPFAYSINHELRAFGFNLAWIVANGNFALLILAMLVRRIPVRVTMNPVYWLLAFVATYWLYIAGRFATPGISAAPTWVILGLSIASFVVSVWARLSLGRNIGLVPAQRQLVTSGAYRFMRHPIYTGIYLAYLALVLQNYSTLNAAIFAIGAALFVIKSFVEEGFLRRDAEYASYMSLVPWRWVPFVV
jgi:protein-S-isoprenylcysteine O-methyltransferase Ste14